ncbi:MAG: hypothetical protein R2726_04785 [Acidimicrobiales bacterium]
MHLERRPEECPTNAGDIGSPLAAMESDWKMAFGELEALTRAINKRAQYLTACRVRVAKADDRGI